MQACKITFHTTGYFRFLNFRFLKKSSSFPSRNSQISSSLYSSVIMQWYFLQYVHIGQLSFVQFFTLKHLIKTISRMIFPTTIDVQNIAIYTETICSIIESIGSIPFSFLVPVCTFRHKQHPF